MIEIKKCIGSPYAMAKEDGEHTYNVVVDEINAKGDVKLDFAGIERATSLFFNESLCKLIDVCGGLESYQKKVYVCNMSDTLKVIYLRALNLTLKKMDDPSIYNEALKEGINLNAEN